MPFIDYEEMQEANRKGESLQRLSDERAMGASILHKDLQQIQYALRQKNIAQIIDRYFSSPRRILEIGCGILDENGRSFFTKGFPQQTALKTSYCDVNPNFENISPEILCVDISELSKVFPKGSFSHVISLNALDTLNSIDLERALEEIYKVLEPGGFLIHCLNFEPFLYAFYNDIIQSYKRVLPFQNESGSHCALIFKEESGSIHPLIEASAHLDAKAREKFWHGILELDKGRALTQIASTLENQGELINAFAHHLANFSRLLKEMRFKIILTEDLTSEKTMEEFSYESLQGIRIDCGPSGISKKSFDDKRKTVIAMHTFLIVASKQ